MKRRAMIAAAACFSLLSGTVPAEEVERGIARSRAAAGELMEGLKRELTTAIREGGPAQAVEVCRKRAPQISETVSAEYGLEIGRTSLRVRNPSNAPEPWEEKVLLSFKERREAGEDPGKMEYSEIVGQDGRKVFRYMKAIPTGELCLLCHGEEISPEVNRKLKEIYPRDRATGFTEGEIRGAFTVKDMMMGEP